MNLTFWKDAGERAANAAWQAAAALEGTGVLNITHLGWLQVLSAAVGAAWLSLTKSLAAAQITGTASLVKPTSKPAAEHDAEVIAQHLAQKLGK